MCIRPIPESRKVVPLVAQPHAFTAVPLVQLVILVIAPLPNPNPDVVQPVALGASMGLAFMEKLGV
jgi:hypothetical protein